MFLIYTDPGKTNISLKLAREKIVKTLRHKERRSYSNHPFSGANWLFVSGSVFGSYQFVSYVYTLFPYLYICIIFCYIYIYNNMLYTSIYIYLFTSYIANRSKNKINVWRDSSYLPGARSIAVYGTRQMGNSDRLKIWGLFFGRQSV